MNGLRVAIAQISPALAREHIDLCRFVESRTGLPCSVGPRFSWRPPLLRSNLALVAREIKRTEEHSGIPPFRRVT